ncbi:MAG: hypothetical protein MZW92_46425 [Comamonadaceae bacterium]|nr:hypothetical protein [Comamonadaceae bacterium]
MEETVARIQHNIQQHRQRLGALRPAQPGTRGAEGRRQRAAGADGRGVQHQVLEADPQ